MVAQNNFDVAALKSAHQHWRAGSRWTPSSQQPPAATVAMQPDCNVLEVDSSEQARIAKPQSPPGHPSHGRVTTHNKLAMNLTKEPSSVQCEGVESIDGSSRIFGTSTISINSSSSSSSRARSSLCFASAQHCGLTAACWMRAKQPWGAVCQQPSSIGCHPLYALQLCSLYGVISGCAAMQMWPSHSTAIEWGGCVGGSALGMLQIGCLVPNRSQLPACISRSSCTAAGRLVKVGKQCSGAGPVAVFHSGHLGKFRSGLVHAVACCARRHLCQIKPLTLRSLMM
jgi:hypothetical protein